MKNNIFGIPKQEGVLLIKEQNNTCYDQVLKKKNFLSEFYTKSEKQQALKNLGVFNEMEFIYNRFNNYLAALNYDNYVIANMINPEEEHTKKLNKKIQIMN